MGGRSAVRTRPTKTDRNNPPQTLFNDQQLRKLRVALGDRFEQVLPQLKAAVRYYKFGPRRETVEEKARRHESATETLERHCQKVLQTLKTTDRLAREACSWGVIDQAVSGASLYDLAIPPWARGEKARAALEDLLLDIQAWHDFASDSGRLPRGRQNQQRLELNRAIGTVLKREGFILSTSRRDRLAFVIRVVDEASGLRPPRDIYKDLRYVCDGLRS